MSPLLSAKQVTSLDVCPPFVEPSAHFRILSSQSHHCIRSWLIHEQVVLCDPLPPPNPPLPNTPLLPGRTHPLCSAGSRAQLVRCLSQRCGRKQHRSESLSAAGGGWRVEAGKKKKRPHRQRLSFCSLIKTTLCLLEGDCDYNRLCAENGDPLFS